MPPWRFMKSQRAKVSVTHTTAIVPYVAASGGTLITLAARRMRGLNQPAAE